MKKTFIQWLIVVAATITLYVLATLQGAMQVVFENDKSYISAIILLLFAICTIWNASLAYSNRIKKLTKLKRLEVSNFCAGHFFSLGILGTLFGLTSAMFESLNAGTAVDVIVKGLRDGLATALLTTLTGIVSAVALSTQNFIIRYNNER